ncbi:MAG: 30S ribosomal protein S16 [Candidatus Colwellbacteria bacterium]|nr:30S ribosomal protein S16 [Candidatus Colwellbacteria bacterium]
MLAIKLKLIGKRGQHSFRVIVQEKRTKLQGEVADDLGWFNPHSNQILLDRKRLQYWIGNGAQPTESAQKIIDKASSDQGVSSFKGRQSPKKRKRDKKTAVPGTPVAMAGGAGLAEEAIQPTVEAKEADLGTVVNETPIEE